MATADLLFDASTFRYPEYVGDLYRLVEESSISSFVFAFMLLNNKPKLAGDQLRECWLHALHQEYRRVMSKTLDMTQDQVQYANELLSRGIKKADAFQWLPASEWEAAEYKPNQKVSYQVQRQVSTRPNFLVSKIPQSKKNQNTLSQNKLPQDYDPLLLLQSMSEIRIHASRFYQDGVLKFMQKTKGIYDSKRVEDYKLVCVCMAQEHVKDQLRVSYAAEEKKRASEIAHGREGVLETPPAWYRWEKEPKWASVFKEIKAERKRIASSLDSGPLAKPTVEHGPLTRNQEKRLLRTTKAKEANRKKKARKATSVQARPSSYEPLTQRYNDSVMQIENGFKNLLRGGDPLEWSLQEQQAGAGETEPMIKHTQEQIFARMNRARKDRKISVRRVEIEKRITAGWNKEKNPVSTLTNKEPSSSISMNDTGKAVPTGPCRMRKHKNIVRFFGDKEKQGPTASGPGISISSHELPAKTEEDVPYLPDWDSKVEEVERVIVKAETHDESSVDGDDKIDLEMSGRIAKLEM